MVSLMDHATPLLQSNDHTAASLILYPEGWQQDTPTADNPLFVELAGNDENPAIKDKNETFDPDLGAELYITNGDTNDFAYHDKDILSFTPEGTPRHSGRDRVRVRGQRDQAHEAEFQRHLPFMLDLAQAAQNPVELPGNQFGATTPDFELDKFN